MGSSIFFALALIEVPRSLLNHIQLSSFVLSRSNKIPKGLLQYPLSGYVVLPRIPGYSTRVYAYPYQQGTGSRRIQVSRGIGLAYRFFRVAVPAKKLTRRAATENDWVYVCLWKIALRRTISRGRKKPVGRKTTPSGFLPACTARTTNEQTSPRHAYCCGVNIFRCVRLRVDRRPAGVSAKGKKGVTSVAVAPNNDHDGAAIK